VKLSPVYDISWPLPTTLEPINLLDKGHIPEQEHICSLWLYFKTLCISNASIEFLPFISPFELTITPALSVEGNLM
jgi:hypothetical protein